MPDMIEKPKSHRLFDAMGEVFVEHREALEAEDA